MTITAAQCRAARVWLAITQAELALASSVSKRTIAAFEAEERPIGALASTALRRAFEAMGVEFMEDGLRVRHPPR